MGLNLSGFKATSGKLLTMSSFSGNNAILFGVNNEVGHAFAWLSIGLAVLTSFLQGLVTAIALMTEASTRWTFRFRLALVEHLWWTGVSILLLGSLIMNALSFASGNGGEPVSVLALSTATFLAIVKYTVPAWQERHYIRTRWLAWTGDSRTSIPRHQASLCGGNKDWRRLIAANSPKLSELRVTPSDYYGWRLLPASGIEYDPTDILNNSNTETQISLSDPEAKLETGIYADGDPYYNKVSLRWGRKQEFRRRVSRAVSSMPLGLLKSFPVTVDGYDGKGLTTAMGILGRNKGPKPRELVFKMDTEVSSHMENFSTWRPRPAKVLRSFYHKTLSAQYGGLGSEFVSAAVELALLLADVPYWAVDKWLEAGLEHQSMETNQDLAKEYLHHATSEERNAALRAHYRSSYVSMIISLNCMDTREESHHEKGNALCRPDLLCLGLLLKAQGHPEPKWWNLESVKARRTGQIEHLGRHSDWKMPMTRLLGLERFPDGFDESPSTWNRQPDDFRSPSAHGVITGADTEGSQQPAIPEKSEKGAVGLVSGAVGDEALIHEAGALGGTNCKCQRVI